MTPELHHWEPSGDSLKVLICLNEKNVEFKSRYVDVLQFRQYEAEHLKLAPMAQVPVLVHGKAVLNEPRLLLEYCEDAFPGVTLAPRDAGGWYDVQDWIRYGDAQLHETVNLLGWHTRVLPGLSEKERHEIARRLAGVPVKEKQAGWGAVVRDAESTEDRLENARVKIREALTRMKKRLGENPWLAGNSYSIADISVYALVRDLPQLMQGETGGEVAAWLNRISGRPAVEKALAVGRNPGAGWIPVQ